MYPTLLVLLLAAAGPACAQDGSESCYSGGSVFAAVFGTIVAIFLVQAVLYFVWNMYWKGKSGQHLVLVTDPEKGESIFAFDNPGFKEGPTILQNDGKENQQVEVKWTQWKPNSGKGTTVSSTPRANGKSKDDSFFCGPPLTMVPLKSHDFTGLGFNICGNMRDGIFIKDVLHRGPASESKRILPGDRIDSIKINFRHMVFEDALTILSYASPYEVEMAVESRNASNTSSLLRTPPPPHKISHPLFRSQSIFDLQRINKSSMKRLGEQPSSLLSDASLGEVRISTLDRKPKPIDPERTQNTRNCIIENTVQKHENTFHEVELNKLDIDEVDSQRKEAPSPSNVKSILVKGIQNLKEKLHHSLHQDEPKEEIKGGVIVNVNAYETPEKKKVVSDGFQSVDLTVPNVPDEVERAGHSARNNRKSGIEEEIESGGEDPVAAKRSKRKAPKPPPSPEDEMVNHQSIEMMDSDEETDKKSGTTIELNSSHITVHQAAESESRKASSLGDLSRYEAESITLLERAVSLELGDGGSCKKRKAPVPPQESSPFKEARIEAPRTGTLKKSSVWGTLEDVIQNGSDSSDADLGISGCSTPENQSDLVTSTPFKFSENGVSNVEISDYKWDVSVPDRSEFMTAIDGEDTPPDLPTSPMPAMSTFVTEIQVTTMKPASENRVIHLDNTQQLFDHINSHHTFSGEDSSMSPTESSKSSPEPMIVEEIKKEIVAPNSPLSFSGHNSPDYYHEEVIIEKQNSPKLFHKEIVIENQDLPKIYSKEITIKDHISPKIQLTEIPIDFEEEDRLTVKEVRTVSEQNGTGNTDEEKHNEFKASNERKSRVRAKSEKEEDEEEGVQKTPPVQQERGRREEKRESKSLKSSPVGRTEGKGGQRSVSVTSIKTSPSKIPVRAGGPRSPGATTSRSSSLQRNGHTSP